MGNIKLKKLYHSDYFPIVVFSIILLIITAFINLGWGDDVWFYNALNNTDKISFLMDKYQVWTSRVVTEFFLVTLVKLPNLWRILNVAVMVLATVSIFKLFNIKKYALSLWIVIALIAIIPIELYYSAGWIATTLNYLWPLAFGLFSIFPIKKILDNRKIRWYEYLAYVPAYIYAINCEQMCAVLFAIYLIFTIYVYHENKKVKLTLIIFTILALAGLVFALSCPGNALREAEETAKYFPDFGSLSLARKMEIGYSSTLFEFIFKPNLLFMIFSLILAISAFSKLTNQIAKLVAAIPLTVNLIFGWFSDIFVKVCPNIDTIKNSLTQYGTGISLGSKQSWIPDMILLVVCLAIIFTLYRIFDDKKYSLLTILIILLGFASRMVMSLSPTIWESGSRTFLFMYFSVVICCYMLYENFVSTKARNAINVQTINYVLAMATMLSFINIIYNL